MRSIKIFNRKIAMMSYPVRNAYGIKSGHDRKDTHLFIVDCDIPEMKEIALGIIEYHLEFYHKGLPYSIIETPHGFHIIVWKRYGFVEMAKKLLNFPLVDFNWIGNGLKRGYWFIETRRPLIQTNERIDYMRIERVGGTERENMKLQNGLTRFWHEKTLRQKSTTQTQSSKTE